MNNTSQETGSDRWPTQNCSNLHDIHTLDLLPIKLGKYLAKKEKVTTAFSLIGNFDKVFVVSATGCVKKSEAPSHPVPDGLGVDSLL